MLRRFSLLILLTALLSSCATRTVKEYEFIYPEPLELPDVIEFIGADTMEKISRPVMYVECETVADILFNANELKFAYEAQKVYSSRLNEYITTITKAIGDYNNGLHR